MKKIIISVTTALLGLFLLVVPVFAHVGVKPSQVSVGAFQTFTVGVPNEREVATIGIRLVIPEGLEHVSPNVKPSWKIEVKHEEMSGENVESNDHSEHKVTEIIWTGGVIPQGQRDDFFFSAKVPVNETTLSWKAYQTYADGQIVSWELTPDMEQPKDEKGNPDFSKFGPASSTKVINDLETKVSESISEKNKGGNTLSLFAIVFSVVALGLHFTKKK